MKHVNSAVMGLVLLVFGSSVQADEHKIEETSPLEPLSKEFKHYAPGIGLVQDGSLKLVRHAGVVQGQK